MNITCPHCGREHALFLLQGTAGTKVCYTCDHYERKVANKNTGTPEVNHIRKRCEYNDTILAREIQELPVVFTKNLAKARSDAHQEKLNL